MSHSPEMGNALPSPLEIVSGAAALAFPLVLAAFVFRYSANVPFYDEFDWAPLILHMHSGTLSFHELWVQHNDHRMFVGNLIALGLANFGGWSQVRECLTSVAVATVGQLFLLMLLRGTFASRTTAVLFVLDSLLLFSFSQEGNWIWGFQTAWFQINACVIGELYFLSRQRLGIGSFVLALLFAYIASFSILFGLTAWPAGAVALALRFTGSGRVRFIVAWIASAAAAFALYFYHYESLLQSQAGIEHASVLSALLYFFAYLGGALGGWTGVVGSAAFGGVGLLAYAVTVRALLRSHASGSSLQRAAPWVALGAYALCCAALTTLGRAGLGADQALENRYITVSTMLWVSLLSLGTIFYETPARGSILRKVLAGSLITGTAFVAIAYAHGFSAMRRQSAQISEFYEIAQNVATASDDQLRRLYPSAEVVRADLEGLRNIGQGPAAAPP